MAKWELPICATAAADEYGLSGRVGSRDSAVALIQEIAVHDWGEAVAAALGRRRERALSTAAWCGLALLEAEAARIDLPPATREAVLKGARRVVDLSEAEHDGEGEAILDAEAAAESLCGWRLLDGDWRALASRAQAALGGGRYETLFLLNEAMRQRSSSTSRRLPWNPILADQIADWSRKSSASAVAPQDIDAAALRVLCLLGGVRLPQPR